MKAKSECSQSNVCCLDQRLTRGPCMAPLADKSDPFINGNKAARYTFDSNQYTEPMKGASTEGGRPSVDWIQLASKPERLRYMRGEREVHVIAHLRWLFEKI
jgi:hypothetical protein